MKSTRKFSKRFHHLHKNILLKDFNKTFLKLFWKNCKQNTNKIFQKFFQNILEIASDDCISEMIWALNASWVVQKMFLWMDFLNNLTINEIFPKKMQEYFRKSFYEKIFKMIHWIFSKTFQPYFGEYFLTILLSRFQKHFKNIPEIASDKWISKR